MPRQARVYIPELPYHIVQTGNNREACFFSSGDYKYYLNLLEDNLQRYGVALHAYVLIEVINQLLDSGANIPPNAILSLTMNSNLQLTKQLMPLGLDLYFKDQQNRNALYYAVTSNASTEMFSFFAMKLLYRDESRMPAMPMILFFGSFVTFIVWNTMTSNGLVTTM